MFFFFCGGIFFCGGGGGGGGGGEKSTCSSRLIYLQTLSWSSFPDSAKASQSLLSFSALTTSGSSLLGVFELSFCMKYTMAATPATRISANNRRTKPVVTRTKHPASFRRYSGSSISGELYLFSSYSAMRGPRKF